MKDLQLLIWLTQLGLSTAVPLCGFVWLAVWLYRSQQWGVWVIITGVILGVISAVDGLRISLKSMERMAKDQRENAPPRFNEHE